MTKCYLIDANYPGVVYTFANEEDLAVGKEAMIKVGCAPYRVTDPRIKTAYEGVWEIQDPVDWSNDA